MNLLNDKISPISEHNTQIRSLTGIRGIFSCYVMFYHLSEYGIGTGNIRNFIVHGYISVDYFFILSGYVMAMTYNKPFKNPFCAKFYWIFLSKRLARIYPLYLFMTLLFCAVSLLGRHATLQLGQVPKLLLENITMINAWGLAPSLDPAAWSISTEWAAYLLFPIFVWAALAGRFRAIILGVLCCSAVIGFAVAPQGFWGLNRMNGPLDITDGTTVWPLARCLALFGVGLLAWRVAQSTQAIRLANTQWFSGSLAALILILLFVSGSDVALIVLGTGLIISISTDRPFVAKLLASRLVYWLGEVSYSIYMVHMLILVAKKRYMMNVNAHSPYANLLLATTLCLVVVCLASLTYYWIEKPGRDAAKQWLGYGGTGIKLLLGAKPLGSK